MSPTKSRSSRGKAGGGKSGSGKSDNPNGPILAKIGPIELDIPRSIGYFGGVGVAVAAGVLDPAVGIFIAAVPFLKMINVPRLPTPPRFLGQVFEGVAKPVGGDSEGTVRLVTGAGSNAPPVTASQG